MSRILRRIAVGVVAVVVLTLIGAIAWTQLGPQPTPAARDAAAAADARGDGWIAYGPDDADVGVVLYPGARIDAAGYAPVARDLASATGARVAIVDAPFDIALLDIDAAAAIQEAHSGVGRWIVGGHSLGGVAAARYAGSRDADVDGLLLWASYPAGDDAVPGSIAVVSVTGSRDEVLNRGAYDDARVLLPRDATSIELDGVTHAQFGDYGTQAGDGAATVADAEARELIVDASSPLVSAVMTPDRPAALRDRTTDGSRGRAIAQHCHGRRGEVHVPSSCG